VYSIYFFTPKSQFLKRVLICTFILVTIYKLQVIMLYFCANTVKTIGLLSGK